MSGGFRRGSGHAKFSQFVNADGAWIFSLTGCMAVNMKHSFEKKSMTVTWKRRKNWLPRFPWHLQHIWGKLIRQNTAFSLWCQSQDTAGEVRPSLTAHLWSPRRRRAGSYRACLRYIPNGKDNSLAFCPELRVGMGVGGMEAGRLTSRPTDRPTNRPRQHLQVEPRAKL